MFAYVGGYTTADRNGRGNGINVFRVDPVSGAWSHVQTVEGLENPSLFTLNRAGTRLYSVHGARSLVSAFSIDRATGRLTMLNQVECNGTNPVDSALDPSERFLIVANYSSGTVAVMQVAEDGSLGAVSQLVTLTGTPGPNSQEQASSHPHGVTFDPAGRHIVVPDKGFDRTFFFRFENGRLTAAEQPHADAAPGSAPRHATFHPSLAALYVNNELDSTVTVFEWLDGRVTEKQVISSLPPDHMGHNTTAEIVASPDGRHLYVSNRGQDSIARFDISQHGGLLTYAGSIPTGGARPRFFTLDPAARHLYVANQDSDSITVFHIDQPTGSLIATGMSISVGSPSAISFVAAS